MASSGFTPNPEFLERYRRIFRSVLVFGFVQIIVLGVYLLLEEIIRSRFAPFFGFASPSLTDGSRTVLRAAFFAAAVACLLVLRFAHNRKIRVLAAAEDSDRVLAGLFRMSFVDLLLAEIPALLGLILFVIAGLNRDFYILVVVSLVLNFMYFPRLKTWDDVLQKKPVVCPR